MIKGEDRQKGTRIMLKKWSFCVVTIATSLFLAVPRVFPALADGSIIQTCRQKEVNLWLTVKLTRKASFYSIPCSLKLIEPPSLL